VKGAALRVLASIYRLHLDKQPGCRPPCYEERKTNQRSEAHLALASAAATRAITLLKNDGVLPLDERRVKTVAVLGTAANAQDTTVKWGEGSPYSGGGSGHVAAPSVVTPLEGIRQRATKVGMNVITSTDGSMDDAKKMAREADVVVVVSAATSAESRDRMSLILSQGANELISAVAGIQPTIVIMESPGAVVTPWRDDVAAVASLFLGGEETGHAWAAVLFGDAEPTGRLPIALPASEFDTIEPVVGGQVNYVEGLLTSYRSQAIRFAYPFGHGLSYTKFKYSSPGVVSGTCVAALCLRVAVTNVGARRGIEVAQAYIRFSPEVGEPKLVLRGFQRTGMLLPGSAEQVQFDFTQRDLSIYQPGRGWVLQRDLQVHIGASSGNIHHVVPVSLQALTEAKA